MTLRLPSSVFIHVPRTGGLWFKEAVRQAGLQRQIFTGDVDSHFGYEQLPSSWLELPAFSFVRHPWSWIKSRWSHCLEYRLYDDYRNFYIHRTFDELVDESFEQTIRNVLDRRPGIVGETFHFMTDGCQRLFRTKDLPDAAVTALRTFEGIDDEQERVVRSVERFNSTSGIEKYLEQPEHVDRSLVEEFLASEQDALTLWEGATCE